MGVRAGISGLARGGAKAGTGHIDERSTCFAVTTAVVTTGLASGFLAAQGPDAALLLLAALGALAAAFLPPVYWALGAVCVAVTFRAITSLGILPTVATYADLPLTWGALALAALKAPSWSRLAQRIGWALVALAVVTVLSGANAGSSPLRWLLTYALVATPYALVLALLLVPPAPGARRATERVAILLGLIQIPLAIVQAVQLSPGDPVQGTFIGSDAGAHLAGAVAVVAAIWLLGRFRRVRNVLTAAALMVVPFLADAKQVIFALPAALVGSPVTKDVGAWLRLTVIVGAVALLAATPSLTDVYALRSIDNYASGQGGKVQVVPALAADLAAGPVTLLFGLGPAETLSQSAVLTVAPLREADSPVAALGLEPASTGLRLGILREFSGSFEHPSSSALGLAGDLGVFGVLPVVLLLVALFTAARRKRTPEAGAAMAIVGLFAVLGLVSTWWELTGFSLYAALFIGLALTTSSSSSDSYRT